MNKQDKYKDFAFFIRVHSYDWIVKTYGMSPNEYCKANNYSYDNKLNGIAWMIKCVNKSTKGYTECKLDKDYVEFDIKELIEAVKEPFGSSTPKVIAGYSYSFDYREYISWHYDLYGGF